MSRGHTLRNYISRRRYCKSIPRYLNTMSFEIAAMIAWPTKDKITIKKNCHIPIDGSRGGGVGSCAVCSSSG